MATYQYRNRGTNQNVFVDSPMFDGNPLWEPITGSGGGGVSQAQLDLVEADTTNIHGITNTALLATLADAQSKADEAAAASIPLGQKGAASGVATLDSGSKVPIGQVPTGTSASTVAIGNDSRITGAAQKSSNLSDLVSPSTARTNLGLGGAALLAVGTSAGTVAAGDDARITGAASAASLTSGLAGKVGKGDLVFNVADYGAVGDGSTNDTSAVQAALTAAPSGATVVLAPGKNYSVAALSISGKNNYTLDGQGATLTYRATGSRIGLTLAGTCTNVTVQNLNIVGNGVLADAHAGIYCSSGQTLSTIRVLNNRISNVTLGVSFSADGSGSLSDILIQGNHVETVIGSTSGNGYGLHHSSSDTTTHQLVKFVNNTIIGAGRHSIYQAKGLGIVITGNTIRDHRVGVADGSLLSAIMIARSGDVVVSGNNLSDGYDSAMTIGGLPLATLSRNYTVTGNSFATAKDNIPFIIVGQQDPETEGFPDGVVIANNAFYSDTTAPAISLYSGKRVRIANNMIQHVITSGTATAIRIGSLDETAGTALYTDDLTVENNSIYMAAGGTKLPLNLSGVETTGIGMRFANNRIVTPGNVFYAPVTLTNPYVSVSGQAATGLAGTWQTGSAVGLNVRDYGAVGNGVVDDTAAFTAAIAAAGSAKQPVYVPGGNYKITGSGLALPGAIKVQGSSRSRSIIAYTGTGTVFSNPTPGTRIFEIHVSDLYVTTATGAIGFDLDSVSTSTFTNVVVTGFSDSGFYLHSAVDGGCVYNRFNNTYVSVCPTGYKVRGSSSNANTWWGCRAVSCSGVGWDLQDSNDNTITASQAEVCGTAFYLFGTVSGANDSTRLRDNRIENCTTGINIASANVRKTFIDGTWIDGSTTTPLTDLGTQTRRGGQFMSVNAAGTLLTFDVGTGLVSGGSLTLGSTTSAVAATATAPLYLRGSVADGASAVGNWIGNGTTLANAAARIVGFCRDTAVTHAQPASYIRLDGSYQFASNGVLVLSGTGTPEGAVTAPVGSLFLRSDGGAGTSMYSKESGAGNTGWVAK